MPSTTTVTARIGRGGAGNTIRTSKSTTSPLPPNTILPSHPSSIISSSTSKPRPKHTGRGGFGNTTTSHLPRTPSNPRLFSFDEELASQLTRAAHPAPIYHVGRGGWANTNINPITAKGEIYIDGRSDRSTSISCRRESTNSETDESASAGGSEKSGGSAPRAILRKIGKKFGG